MGGQHTVKGAVLHLDIIIVKGRHVVNIYSKYKEVLESKKFELGEDMIDIQTRRILNAEMAALEYSK